MNFDLCSDYHVLEALRIIRFIILVLRIAIPVLLIVLGSMDFFKTVLDPDKDDISKQARQIGTRVLSAFIIFLLPSIIKLAFSFTANFADLSFIMTTCFENAETSYINQLKQIEKERLQSYENNSVSYKSKYSVSRYVLKKSKNTGVGSMYSFIMQYEGNEGYCDSSNTQYKAVDIGDGVVTIGYGVTNHIFDVNLGDCVDTEIVDDYFMKHVDEKKEFVEGLVKQTNITDWDDAKTTAAISLGYNCGDDYAKKLVQSYAASGNDGALNTFKSCTHAGNGNESFTEGLKTRRDGEYELFTTGNYDTGFYERTRKYIE